MNLGKFFIATALATSLALTGCSVEQTREAQVPDVDVRAEGGQMPQYDVDTADVDVTTERRNVSVPDVDVSTEEKQVEVPDVNVTMPENK